MKLLFLLSGCSAIPSCLQFEALLWFTNFRHEWSELQQNEAYCMQILHQRKNEVPVEPNPDQLKEDLRNIITDYFEGST